MKLNHQLLKFIQSVRNAHDNNIKIYTQGSCYQFCLMLRTIFPGEIVYDYLNGHCYFKHQDVYYDILGHHFKIPQEIQHHEMYEFPHKPHRWK